MAKRRWDEHHILYQRRSWIRDSHGRVLRSHSGLIIPMDTTVHRELHRDKDLWQGVPIMGHSALGMIRSIYGEGYTRSKPLENVDKLLNAISKVKDPKAELAAHAIELQLPYLIDGQWSVD